MFRSYQPDLVLLDIMLPIMDGWSVLKKIREGAKTPALAAHVLQLLPQALDVYVYRAAVAKVVEAPHLVQQLVPGEHPVCRARRPRRTDQLKRGGIPCVPSTAAS